LCLLNHSFPIFPFGAIVMIWDTYICLYFCCSVYGDVVSIEVVISYSLLERYYAFNCSFRASVGQFVYRDSALSVWVAILCQ
jgi:hypothetical protein